MASLGRQITAAIKTAIAGITTGGGYHYDLDGTGVVRVGGEIIEGDYPAVNIEPVGMQSGRAQIPGGVGAVSLRRYGRAYTRSIWARVAHNGDAESAAQAAEDLLDDLATAIEASRQLGLSASGVIDLQVDGQSFGGGEEGVTGGASAFVMVTVYAAVTTGA